MTTPSSDPPAPPSSQPQEPAAVSLNTLALLQEDQRRLWAAGERPLVEHYLARYPRLRDNRDAQLLLLVEEFRLREGAGQQPTVEEYAARFPQLAEALRGLLDVCRSLAEPPPARTDSSSALAEAETMPPRSQQAGTGPVIAPHTASPARVSQAGQTPSGAGGVGVPLVPGYAVLGMLGRGGMGVVYQAEHIALRRIVALKMILHGDYADEAVRRRFHTEAQTIARLTHPHIVQVYEVGEHNGLPYFSLEYCPGGSLEKKLDGTPWEPARAAALVQTLAQAVHAAHQAELVHRDLKPGNILLTTDGTPKITDFGLVKRLDVTGDTQSNMIMGTPEYMAPEQAGGKSKHVGTGADIYALGVILYELLTGRPPFKAATPFDTVLQVVAEEPVPVRRFQPKTPKDLDTICLKCLQKAPAKRYPSAAELADDLQRFVEHKPIQARPIGRIERAIKWMRRRPAVAALWAAVLLVSAAGIGAFAWAYGEALRKGKEASDRLTALEEEQRQRVLARIDLLRTASPDAVPGILADLKQGSPEVQRRLWELWQQEDQPRQRLRRMRVGLALAGTETEHVQEALLTWMLQADDPREVLLAREALRRSAPAQKAALWRCAGDKGIPAEGRLRALVALALFDRAGAGWKTAAGAAVEQLLGSNALHLGTWTEGFRPAAASLIKPLAEQFRSGKTADRRRAAAEVLLAWAADQPALLADLLLDADEQQFAKLWPALTAHGEAALIPLRQELKKQPTFDWKDTLIPPEWGQPAAELVRHLEAADGMVTERFALCQSLPLKEFAAVAEALRQVKYRPVRVRPYAAAGSVRTAAVWVRDDRDWQVKLGGTAAQVRHLEKEQRTQGRQPADIASYLEGDKERYAVLFVAAGKDEDARLYVGLRDGLHRDEGLGPMRKQKRNPATMQVLMTAKGEARHNAVWRLGMPEGDAFLWDDEGTHAEAGLSRGLAIDVSLAEVPLSVLLKRSELPALFSGSPWLRLAWHQQAAPVRHPERRYTGCFSGSAAFDHVVVLGVTRQQQVQRGCQLIAQGYRPVALSVARVAGEVLSACVWHRPVIADAKKEQLAKRQANATVGLFRAGEAATLWPLLEHRPDPRLRSYLIARLGPLGADIHKIIARLEDKAEVSEKRALILCLGDFGAEALPEAERAALLEWLVAAYRDDPDPGVHGAAEWLLRQWQQHKRLEQVDAQLQKRDRKVAAGDQLPPGGRRWYVNGTGQTMVLVLDPPDFVMGTPRTEEGREGGTEGKVEKQHRRWIGRSFAIGSKEVTVEQFLRFRDSHTYNKTYSPPGHPINQVSWYQAAEYCNWLSKQEGLLEDEWCYVPNVKGEYGEGMRLRPNWQKLRGYRLPTEAEWEYAARAGAITSRYYGETDELLGRYAWYAGNSQSKAMLLPASLLPNDLGLFDMLGNAAEWIHDPVFDYPENLHGKPVEDIGYAGDIRYIGDSIGRILRGGAFFIQPTYVRCGPRDWFAPAYRSGDVGFRPARTFR
jgi:formylglycine-generating enzyme required for sulfatase activity/tRNA A-37 threonylcarbamoyl transferase component Bud32